LQEATEVTKNERIGYLPEESYLYKYLTAEETLDFYGRLFDMPAKRRRERAAVGTREMKDMIIKLRDQGKTVVMCSHLLADVQDVCDRIAILYQGDLKELGRVDDLLKVTDETQIRANGISPEAEAEIRDVIAKHGGKTLSVENPKSTLEDLFLGIVRESQNRPGIRSAGATEKSEDKSK